MRGRRIYPQFLWISSGETRGFLALARGKTPWSKKRRGVLFITPYNVMGVTARPGAGKGGSSDPDGAGNAGLSAAPTPRLRRLLGSAGGFLKIPLFIRLFGKSGVVDRAVNRRQNKKAPESGNSPRPKALDQHQDCENNRFRDTDFKPDCTDFELNYHVKASFLSEACRQDQCPTFSGLGAGLSRYPVRPARIIKSHRRTFDVDGIFFVSNFVTDCLKRSISGGFAACAFVRDPDAHQRVDEGDTLEIRLPMAGYAAFRWSGFG